jgi:predicted amidophosphoribosyltransferase
MGIGGLLAGEILHLVWPARCAGCDEGLERDRQIFCEICAEALNPIGRACASCASPLTDFLQVGDGRRAVHGCPACLSCTFAFSRAFAGFEYGASLASALVRMKHGDRPDLAPRLARLLAAPLWQAIQPGRSPGAGGEGGAHDRSSFPEADVVVPVPLHPRKLRRRGFNQALELACGALRARPHPVPPGSRAPRLERDLLRRVRDTPELGRQGPGARRAQVAGAFAVVDPRRVHGLRFVIVDDVMTTGATLDACGEALLEAGAAEVRVVALARAVSSISSVLNTSAPR